MLALWEFFNDLGLVFSLSDQVNRIGARKRSPLTLCRFLFPAPEAAKGDQE